MKELFSTLRDFARTHDLEAFWDAPGERMAGFPLHAAVRELVRTREERFSLGDALAALEANMNEEAPLLFASLSWMETELWALRRWTQAAALDEQGAKIKQIRLGMPREELEAWAVNRRVSPWLDMPAGYISAVLYNGWPRIWSIEDRWSLAQIICDGPIWTHAKRLPRNTREDAQRLINEVATTRPQLKPLPQPEQGTPVATLRDALDAAWAEHARVMTVRPNLKAVYQSTIIDEDAVHEPLLYRAARYQAPCEMDGQPCVRIGQAASGELTIRCDCARGAHRPCPMKMEAIRAWQEVTGRAEAAEQRARLARLLAAPAWQRQLDGLLELLAVGSPVREEEWLGWKVEESGRWGLDVRPVLVRNKKRGGGFTSRQLSQGAAADLLSDLPPSAAAERERLRLHLAIQASGRHSEEVVELLCLLAGQPNVYVQDEDGLVPLKIEADHVALELDQEGSRPIATLTSASGPLTEAQLATLRKMPPQTGGVIFSPVSRGALRLLIASGPMVRAANKLRGARLELPPEASAYMSQRAAGLLGRTDVKLGGSLRGREVQPALRLLARLERAGADGGLSLMLRVRPLEGAAAVIPGQQPELLQAVTDQGPIFTRRKLGAEQALLDRAVTALELEVDKAVELAWALDAPDEALVMLERLKDAERRELLAIEWSQRPMIYSNEDSAQRLQLKVRPADRYFQIDGKLELGDGGSIPLGLLLAAAREGKRWVRMGEDQWLKLEGQLARSVEQLARAMEAGKDTLNPLAAPVLMEAEAQGVQIDAPPKWLQHTAKIRAARDLSPHVPRTFRAELRAYQREGYVWLLRLASWAPGAVLADDMGLGKTIQALAVLLKRAKGGPALVVAPASVCVNWQREAAQFAPDLKITTVRNGQDVDALVSPSASQVVVIGYDLLARHIDKMAEIKWETAVFDEAQSIKNPSTLRFKAICKLDVAFRIALTGTPVENHTGELWSIFAASVPGLLGTQTGFAKRFQGPIERDEDAGARAALASIISPFVLRRLKRDVASELPPRTDIRLDVELSGAELERYELFRRSALEEIMRRGAGGVEDGAEEQDRFAILAAITRLRQLACHPRLMEPKSKLTSSKVETLREKIAELREEGHRALVFSQFVKLLELTREALEADGVRCVSLDGSMTTKQRQAAIDSFQAGEHDVFLLSIKAGGVGLNLTAANFVFLLDPWWNPAVEDQATDRAHRIGQESPVTVYRLVAQGTIEEAIYTMHEDKRALMDAVLSESGSARALSPEELRALLM
jgi:superfamily II DNA or RNA helicase